MFLPLDLNFGNKILETLEQALIEHFEVDSSRLGEKLAVTTGNEAPLYNSLTVKSKIRLHVSRSPDADTAVKEYAKLVQHGDFIEATSTVWQEASTFLATATQMLIDDGQAFFLWKDLMLLDIVDRAGIHGQTTLAAILEVVIAQRLELLSSEKISLHKLTVEARGTVVQARVRVKCAIDVGRAAYLATALDDMLVDNSLESMLRKGDAQIQMFAKTFSIRPVPRFGAATTAAPLLSIGKRVTYIIKHEFIRVNFDEFGDGARFVSGLEKAFHRVWNLDSDAGEQAAVIEMKPDGKNQMVMTASNVTLLISRVQDVGLRGLEELLLSRFLDALRSGDEAMFAFVVITTQSFVSLKTTSTIPQAQTVTGQPPSPGAPTSTAAGAASTTNRSNAVTPPSGGGGKSAGKGGSGLPKPPSSPDTVGECKAWGRPQASCVNQTHNLCTASPRCVWIPASTTTTSTPTTKTTRTTTTTTEAPRNSSTTGTTMQAAVKCNDNGRKDKMWGTVIHTGTPDQCAEYADQLTDLVVSCGRKSAARPGKGFSCMASKENAGENLLGTIASAKDCKGLAKFVTKALKKIQRKPVIKFVCEAYGDAGFMHMYVKAKRQCSASTKSMDDLVTLFVGKQFEKCTAPAQKPSKVINCMPHHAQHAEDTATDVFQSSVATCPVQVTAIKKILKSCGLSPKYEGSIKCSAGVDGSSMIVASGESKQTTRAWTKAMRVYKSSLPTVEDVAGAFTNKRKCFQLAPELNDMIDKGFECPALP